MKFFRGLCKAVVRLRFVVVAFWLIAAAVIYFTAPSLSDVTKSDAASFFTNDAEAVKAGNLYRELFPEEGSHASFIVAVANDGGLNDADRQYAKSLEAYLAGAKDKYLIKDVSSPFTDKDLETAMISQDGKAAVIKVSMSTGGWMDNTNEAIRQAKKDIASGTSGAPAIPQGLAVHITGDAVLGQEQVDNVKGSLELTTKITLVLIVVILLVIYRSPLAPVLPLATIGLSFLITRGIVALLTLAGLKASSFTETFLIAILFGAGTDYCLLLISRYREELVNGLSPGDALAAAFPHTAGAIISSGGTVIIGFLGMVLAKFGLFSSTGPAIAIGVGVTMLAVLTLTPALIGILGEHIFWPAHPSKNRVREQRGSPFWNRLSLAVTRRPMAFLLVAVVVFLPFIVMSRGINRTFDNLAELPKNSEAVAGFDTIKAHFNQGELLPVRVVLKAGGDLWPNGALQAIDNVASGILKVDGVAKVRTATRPAGDPLNELSLPSQIAALTSGLGQAGEGFDSLSGGITTIKDGINEAADGIGKGADGMGELSAGTGAASGGLGEIGTGLGKLSAAEQKAIAGLTAMKTGMNGLTGGLTGTGTGIDGMLAALGGAKHSMEVLLATNPALMMDVNFQTAYGTVTALIGNIPAMQKGITGLKGGVAQSQKGLADAASGLKKIKSGIDQSKVALTEVQKGLGDIKTGQADAADKLKQASDSLKLISDGLDKSLEGISTMKTELNGAGKSADEWSAGLKDVNPVFYLPEGTMEKYPELKKAMQAYISPDGRGVVVDVVLTLQPYEGQALDSIAKIKDAVAFSMKGGPLEGSQFYVSGATATMSELRDITASDFITVMIFVLLGIFVVLAILLRSLIAPFYLILTILFSYLTTLGISWLVFQVGLGRDGVSWSVPFFSFVLLVALGVDYNIFLMSRVKEEYRPGDMAGGTARAVASTGKIITSCGIIMAGTFAALLVSPVNELVQVGFTTVVGLILDTFIVRCMLVPALAVKVGELNWWPGRKVKILAVESPQPLDSDISQQIPPVT